MANFIDIFGEDFSEDNKLPVSNASRYYLPESNTRNMTVSPDSEFSSDTYRRISCASVDIAV